ncbi:MAG: NTP transferase domain-containing protein, partial [bacterium]
MTESHAVVLAAGKGTRMKSDKPKVCHDVFGEPMIVHVVRSLREASVDSITVVVGAGEDVVRGTLDNYGLADWVHYATQENQNGTGHAVQVALDQSGIPDDSTVLITCGDIPGIRPGTFGRLTGENEAELGVLTVRLDDPSGYGRVITNGSEHIHEIVEHVD